MLSALYNYIVFFFRTRPISEDCIVILTNHIHYGDNIDASLILMLPDDCLEY